MDKTPSDYIALDRRFRSHDEKRRVDDAAAESYLTHWGRSELTDWIKMLTMPGIHVVLGEAGSGRTYEFKALANALITENKEAFFLSLHKLATMDVSQVMDTDDHQRLKHCLESNREAWFFLDAVDESKLQRVSQFREALDKFAALIRPGRGKARVFLSSRVKDWLPMTDRRHVQEALGILCAPATRDSDEDEASEPPGKQLQVHVWTIAPLDKEQVRRYVEGRGVTDAEQFIQAVDASYAWELAARPLDVNLLVSYWMKHRVIGKPAEMYEHFITEQLRERPDKLDYERQYPLEPGRAREGAETLAAATILCRRLDFRIEDETHAGSGGLDACACLPDDWSSLALHALLSRPLFDAAIYGTTRFHHRGFAEYLAARWFMRLLSRECPVEEVWGQLFISSRGNWWACQSRLPVAVWLACLGAGSWCQEIREKLLETAPEAFFRYGDPSLLSIEFKERILDAVAQRYQDRDTVRFELSDVALSRMGEPALAAALIRHLESPALSTALKTEFTKLARVGRIHAAVPLLLILLRGGVGDDNFEAYIFWAIEDLGTEQQKRELAEWVLSLASIDGDTCGLVIQILFPDILPPSDLRSLMSRLQPSPEISHSLTYYLEEACKTLSEKQSVRQLLEELLVLLELPPCHHRSVVSRQFAWLAPATRVLLRKLLKESSLSTEESEVAARALWVCTQTKEVQSLEYAIHSSEDEPENLDTLTRCHPSVRQKAFWFHYNQNQLIRSQDGPPNIASLVWCYHLKFGNPNHEDFEWICHDLQASPRNREAVFGLAIDFWNASGRRRTVKNKILSAIHGACELEQTFAKCSKPLWLSWLSLWWKRQEWGGIRSRYWWINRWRKVTGFYWEIRNFFLAPLALEKHSSR